ncbi:MAG: glycosyltransferase family 2 protein [Candidatus Moraniibacteriota bacterium]|nr:MAG: glycosyltransferase family 2 protein [Candidatus Moranbacteria bacterium]
MNKDSPDISFLIVNYRSASRLPACFSSLKNLALPLSFECIVANNDPSEENALQDLQKDFSFDLLPLSKNRGFGRAVNMAARRSRGTVLFLLNPDARFLSGNMTELVRCFEKNPSLGAVGMQLLEERDRPQPWSFGSPVTLLRIARNHLSRPQEILRETPEHFVETSWVSGAALAIPRSLFFRIQGFDERFFLYFEDIDLCTRVQMLGKKVGLFPSARVLHVGGASMPKKRLQKKWYYRSQDFYFQKHRPPYEQFLLKILRKCFGKY